MRLTQKLKNKIQVLILPLILLLAAFLRLYRIADYMTFLGDEGRDVLKVYEILHGQLTLLGPTSSVGGFFLGPIYYYFMAPFLWLFNYNPVGPAVMVALIGTATVLLLFIFTSELFNKRVALVASLLYSVSPLVIAYSRSSWNPNILPFFSLLTIYLLYKAVKKQNLKFFFAVGFLLGIDIQLHYLTLFLGAIVFLYVIFSEMLPGKVNIKKIQKIIKYNLFMFLGFILGWMPFILFELRHDFLNFKKIFEFVIYSGNTGVSTGYLQVGMDVFFRLFARLVTGYPLQEHFYRFDKMFIVLWTGLAFAIGIAASAYLLSKLFLTLKSKNKNYDKYLLLSIWFFVSLALFALYKKPIYDYYFTYLFPLPFILVSLVFSLLYESKNKIIQFTPVILLVILLFLNIQGLPFRYEPNRQLNQMRSIADFIMTKTEGKAFNFALITGGNSDHAYRYFFTLWNNPPKVIEDPTRDPKRLTVTNQLFVICESIPCEPLGNSLWEIAGFGRADIAGKWKVSVVEVYKLVHYKEK